MFLTRMKLDTDNRNTMRALNAPNRIHGAVESAFSGERRRCLWRIDNLKGQTYLLILSEEEPDLKNAAAQFGAESWETVSYDPLLERITEGSRWYFRLVANPTESKAQGKGKRGKVHAHVTPQYQKEWLLSRASDHGFSVDMDSFDVKHSQWFQFQKRQSGPEVSLLQVTFEGRLTVTSPEKFRNMLTEGIGRAKAYGMGLMTVIASA